MTFRVAITGGIGSGKSTVAEQFAALGATVSDADAISHELTGPGGEALPAITAAFGREVIDQHGALDRARLRTCVFADPNARQTLEAILHPMIRERMLAETASIEGPYALLVIPLLFETGQQDLVARVLVVDVPESLQIARVQARSGLPRAEIARIMATQIKRTQRCARADDLIDNSSDLDRLRPQVEQLHRHYLDLARQHPH